jgi:photosystem II stability/assembly factor-like uncharacterized protein
LTLSAVGEQGFITTSADGTIWSDLSTSPTAENLEDVAWFNGRFYAVGTNGIILSSADGQIWSQVTSPATTTKLTSITYNGMTGTDSLYVAAGYNLIYTSNDGLTWSEATQSPTGFINDVTWGGGSDNIFVAVGLSNLIYSSSDGQTWTRRFLDASPILQQMDIHKIVWTGSQFIATGDKGSILASTEMG